MTALSGFPRRNRANLAAGPGRLLVDLDADADHVLSVLDRLAEDYQVVVE